MTPGTSQRGVVYIVKEISNQVKNAGDKYLMNETRKRGLQK